MSLNLYGFATDDYDNSWKKKTIPKKFLNKDCRKLVKKYFVKANIYIRIRLNNQRSTKTLLLGKLIM